MFIPNLLSSADSGGEISLATRIAIVEDEPDLREAVAEYLGANGYEVARMADLAIDEIERFLRGEPLRFQVEATDLSRIA